MSLSTDDVLYLLSLFKPPPSTGTTVIEVEEPVLDRAHGALPELQAVLSGFDFVQGLVSLAPFRSGGVAATKTSS